MLNCKLQQLLLLLPGNSQCHNGIVEGLVMVTSQTTQGHVSHVTQALACSNAMSGGHAMSADGSRRAVNLSVSAAVSCSQDIPCC